jgi:hypothetical protein
MVTMLRDSACMIETIKQRERRPMEQGQPRPPVFGVSVAQISSGALASVTAAVVASYFGVGGTLIGAAITSVVATLGGALYRQSIERAQARVLIRRNPHTGVVTREIVPPAAGKSPCRFRIRWGPIGVSIFLVFTLALGSITAFEAVAKKPVASLLGRAETDSGRTSLGMVVQEVGNSAPTAEPTALPGVGDTPTAAVNGTTTPASTEIVVPGAMPTRTTVIKPTVTPTPAAVPSSAPGQPAIQPPAPTAPARPAGTPVAP